MRARRRVCYDPNCFFLESEEGLNNNININNNNNDNDNNLLTGCPRHTKSFSVRPCCRRHYI